MSPTKNRLLVEKRKSDGKQPFEIVSDDNEYVVVFSSSKLYKKGDRVLFSDSRSFKYRGKDYIIVHEDNIEAFDAN